MNIQINDGATGSQPQDKTLDAYKGWVMEIARRLMTQNTVNLTEAEWIANWKEYWNEISASRRNQNIRPR